MLFYPFNELLNIPALLFIDKVNNSLLDAEFIKNLGIIYIRLYEVNKYKKISSEINLNMHFYSSFSISEFCPWTCTQTETDSATIKRLDHIIKV